MNNVESAVIESVKSQSGVLTVSRETSLEELALDSFDKIEIAMDIEESFDISLNEPELEEVDTVEDFIRLVESKK